MWYIIDLFKEHIITIVAVISALITLWNWVAKPVRKLAERDKRQEEDLADLLWDRLQQAHDHFMHRGWCSAAEKERLVTMHKHYQARGRNHLSENYERDILSLPERPTNEEGD